MAFKPDLIFDVGMHKGEDTDFYLKKGFTVIAFEANPDLVGHCKVRFQDPIASGRLLIVEGAIASAEAGETITFYKNERVSVFGTTFANLAARNAGMFGARSVKIEVPRTDIETAFQVYGIPFYLKIDIEGADTLVLGALAKLDGRPQFLSFETDITDAKNFKNLISELELVHDLGYRRFNFVQQASIPGTRIVTQTFQGEHLDYVFEPEATGPFGNDLQSPWMNYEKCRKEYKRLYFLQRYFGYQSSLSGVRGAWPLNKVCIRFVERLTSENISKGWYDLHARLD
jgi:FkbM family methyltransferase